MTKWEKFEKLPRPLLRWFSLPAVVWVAGGCDVAGYPLDGVTRGLLLTFVLSVYGIRAVEKLKAMA